MDGKITKYYKDKTGFSFFSL